MSYQVFSIKDAVNYIECGRMFLFEKYKKFVWRELNPKIAVEVLIGHGTCHIICETSIHIRNKDVIAAVNRIAGDIIVDYKEVPQDPHLSNNQAGKFRCGDNGIFKGVPVSEGTFDRLADNMN